MGKIKSICHTLVVVVVVVVVGTMGICD